MTESTGGEREEKALMKEKWLLYSLPRPSELNSHALRALSDSDCVSVSNSTELKLRITHSYFKIYFFFSFLSFVIVRCRH